MLVPIHHNLIHIGLDLSFQYYAQEEIGCNFFYLCYYYYKVKLNDVTSAFSELLVA